MQLFLKDALWNAMRRVCKDFDADDDEGYCWELMCHSLQIDVASSPMLAFHKGVISLDTEGIPEQRTILDWDLATAAIAQFRLPFSLVSRAKAQSSQLAAAG